MEKKFTEKELKKMNEMFNATFGEKIIIPTTENDENNYYGAGFYVCKREGKFWLSYGGIKHGGGAVIHEIPEDEYMKIRDGRILLSSLMDLYPERDGDVERGLKIEARWFNT